MEFRHPWRATEPCQRLEAIKAYVEGERLCNIGDFESGILLLRRAAFLAWELEGEDWPAWARALYAQVQEGANDLEPPPLLAHEESDHGLYNTFVPFSVRSRPAEASSVADTLAVQYFVVLDGFAGATLARAFRASCETAWRDQKIFQPAKVSTAVPGVQGARSALTRSDHLAWLDLPTTNLEAEGNVDGWAALSSIIGRIDTLVAELALRMVPSAASSLRHRPQLARYGKGDAFARHTDNHCPASGVGPLCNGRWLTAIYYAGTEGWQHDLHGVCLRLYRSQGVSEEEQRPERQLDYEDDARVDIAPLEDRLILFLSDFRVPHAVLPVLSDGQDRFAATCWYSIEHG
jgi:Rps23 Pro-64 3,4-dihydroxylase Tpa1-like proline 4-hydroxylase